MDDPVDVRPHAIDQQVHANLAGDLAPAFQLASFHVHDDKVGGLHHALRHTGGGDKNALIVEPDGDVSVSGSYEAAGVQ